MAYVFITPILVRVHLAADRPVAGRETAEPPMARATECCRRFDFLAEDESGKTYLVDTGAAVSVMPFRGRPATATAYLTGPDSTVIPAWGTVQLQLRFGGQTFAGDFVQAAVNKPILGRIFWHAISYWWMQPIAVCCTTLHSALWHRQVSPAADRRSAPLTAISRRLFVIFLQLFLL
jgi:hypothetical protein